MIQNYEHIVDQFASIINTENIKELIKMLYNHNYIVPEILQNLWNEHNYIAFNKYSNKYDNYYYKLSYHLPNNFIEEIDLKESILNANYIAIGFQNKNIAIYYDYISLIKDLNPPVILGENKLNLNYFLRKRKLKKITNETF